MSAVGGEFLAIGGGSISFTAFGLLLSLLLQFAEDLSNKELTEVINESYIEKCRPFLFFWGGANLHVILDQRFERRRGDQGRLFGCECCEEVQGRERLPQTEAACKPTVK